MRLLRRFAPRKDILLITYSLLFTTHLSAEVIDRIVAIVGDKIITQSEIEEAVFLLPDIDKRDILDQLIERELLLVEAKKETLEVEIEEVESAVENAILSVRGRFPSDEDYELELRRAGMTEEDLRIKYREEMEQKMLIQKLFQKKFGKELAVSDLEVMDFYNIHIDSIPPLPDAIKFLGVVVYYGISDSAKAFAQSKAEKILAHIKRGKETFEELVQKYSDDPMSKKRGGNLGSLNLRDLGKEFQPIVGNMIPGEVAIVPSVDAYHIVKCNERHEELINLSDIVIKIVPTRSDSQFVQQIVDSVVNRFRMLDTGYWIPDSIPKFQIPDSRLQTISWGEEFVPLSATSFESLELIELGKVYTFNTPNGVQVIKPIDKRAGHIPAWQEIREELKNLVYQRKLQARYERLINKLKEEVFVKKML